MIITKKHIPRRLFLRGVGVTLALPLLDAMVPALTALQNTAAKPRTRLGLFYVPNGIIMNQWTPTADGAGFELTPILEPLAPFRDQLVVLTGLNSQAAVQLPGEPAGDHPRACAAYMTGIHPRATAGVDIRSGISMDQIAARDLGKQTQLASLELGIESAETVGGCIGTYSCAYSNTFVWRSPTTPLPMENQPRAVFERLFGESDSTDPGVQRLRIQKNRSILDFLRGESARLLTALGPDDRNKVNQYFESIRDVERRVQLAEQQAGSERLPELTRPGGIPETFTQHAKLMNDLQVLAYQADLTRVCSFMVGHEMSNQSYPEINFVDPYHAVTHHSGNPAMIAKCVEVNIFHIRQFAYLLEKLRATPDGDGTLLDQSMMLYGSPLSDGNHHLTKNLPVLIAGGASGQIKGNRHLRYPVDTPITNLYLTMLEKMGVPTETMGDSTGTIAL